MRRRHPESLLEKPPLPEYEEDFGHQFEKVVAGFINNRCLGIRCEHATESEDLTQATDLWLILDRIDRRLPLQITITDNPEILARKEKRGPIIIHVPKELAAEAWRNYDSTHQENPDVEFTYEFLPKQAQEIIIQELMEHPDIKRYMLAQAEKLYYKDKP